MENLLASIRKCDFCKAHLPLGPRPIVSANPTSRIAIIGQAPGSRVHATGIPWDDPSGKQLRKWMDVDDETFYNAGKIALIPMGFCYPGKGKSGDLPPRTECAPQWHSELIEKMPKLDLVVLIGMYAQNYYLKSDAQKTLTETVRNYNAYLPKYFPLPHPSPRNRFWLSKNPWFDANVLPEFRARIKKLLPN
ncbi:MAG: uracil-DNA glycosylase family protein [Flavobacteriaceae bacterium]|nr:uracil-DNA glycosylase family protein [Flavobacteriaceae bacterium]